MIARLVIARRAVKIAAVAVATSFASMAPAPQASGQTEPEREIAIVVRVSMRAPFDVHGRDVAAAARRADEVRRQLAALRDDQLGSVPYALSVSGMLCDELHLMRARPARALAAELRRQAQTSPILSSAYADVRLSDVSIRRIGREVSDGITAIERCTHSTPRSLFFPPGLTLPDDDLLEPMRDAGVVVALSAFAVPPTSPRPTIVPAVALASRPDIDSLLAARPESRSVVVVLDTAVHDVAAVVREIAEDPRFALRDVTALAKVDVTRGEIDPARSTTSRYRDAIARASDALEALRWFTLPDNRLVGVYRTVLARVRSSAEWTPDYAKATRRAQSLRRALRAEQARVTVATGGSVTFTSSGGSIPVTITNRARYPVWLRVEVSSPKLRFPPDAGPCASPRPTCAAQVATVDPPGDTITFAAIARSTGTFPTNISLRARRGDLELDSGRLTVRSTAANLSAVVLTAGGALFLIGWFFRRIRQRVAADAPS